ncbi:MAG TPA: hypothetical protein PLF32_04285 [Bacteroidales bacterium]|nr:hypothetical protein [Bacteroidales bacterium]HOR81851.1 hypothetical protein [Bacteroidales bacterium]
MNLLKKYTEIFSETLDFSYYSSLRHEEMPFIDYKVGINFIKEQFKLGSKDNVFDADFEFDKIRVIHTLSTYTLGLILEPLFQLNHNLTLKCKEEPNFKYFWFLACLYHDYCYFVENRKGIFATKLQLGDVLDKLSVEYNLLEVAKKLTYKKETIENYYKFCLEKHGFHNHGIIGGILLYDRLRKNYLSVKNEALGQNIVNVEKDDFIYKDLHWSKDHEEFYEIAADAIISHNIWLSKDKDQDTDFKEYSLNELLSKNKKKIKCERSLLGLLAICDTIEPTKSFNQFETKCILEKIELSISKSDKLISLKIVDNCINPEHWFKKIMDLNTWIEVEVKKDEEFENTILIKLIG